MNSEPTTAPTSATERNKHRAAPWKRLTIAGALSGAIAAACTSVIATVAKALDVPLEAPRGDEIQIALVAISTTIGAGAGILLAAVVTRRSSHPNRDFINIAAGLTLASFASPLLFDTDRASKTVLVITHIVAALIIIPAISSQLDQRATQPIEQP